MFSPLQQTPFQSLQTDDSINGENSTASFTPKNEIFIITTQIMEDYNRRLKKYESEKIKIQLCYIDLEELLKTPNITNKTYINKKSLETLTSLLHICEKISKIHKIKFGITQLDSTHQSNFLRYRNQELGVQTDKSEKLKERPPIIAEIVEEYNERLKRYHSKRIIQEFTKADLEAKLSKSTIPEENRDTHKRELTLTTTHLSSLREKIASLEKMLLEISQIYSNPPGSS